MRPVNRGSASAEFMHYRDARDPLIRRIGDFCSYCETALHTAAHIEHVRPKSLHAGLALTWDNFLLACDSCNATKGDTDVALDQYFWPDAHNTARAFRYAVDLPPAVADGLTPDEAATARRTIRLTGLDRHPGHPRCTGADRRWFKRHEAWGVALRCHLDLRANDTDQMRLAITLTAISRGFFSVWMAAFHDDADMRRRFVAAFPGTAAACFDADGNPVRRLAR